MIESEQTSTLVFFINGRKVEESNVDPEWTLLYYLRKKLRLCGTKLGCSEGGCGACTVMVSKYNRKTQKIIHFSVNACLAPLVTLHGLSVTTVEGIGSTKEKLHPVQERIAKGHGSQCGFCTPGIVMSMYTLLRNNPNKLTMKDLQTAFQGNLCRCTGYRPILEAYRSFTSDGSKQKLQRNGICTMGENCCQFGGGDCKNDLPELQECEDKLFDSSQFQPYDPSQEPIFPPELSVSKKYDNEFLVFRGPRTTWYRPTNLNELIELKQTFPAARIINGNTEVGIEVKFKNCVYNTLISPTLIQEMTNIWEENNFLKVGSAVTLSALEEYINDIVFKKPDYSVRILVALKEMLSVFAGKQIRNVGTVGGNIMTGSPISDLNPIFVAANCKLDLTSKDGPQREVYMDRNFWLGYRRNIVKPHELLLAIYIPFTEKNQYFKAYKQSKRRDDDIAIVNAAYFIELEEEKIINARFAYGGMAPTIVMTVTTCSMLKGKQWSEILPETLEQLSKELQLSSDAPGGLIEYRRTLSLSLFFKFFLTVNEILNALLVPASVKSACNKFNTLPPESSQIFFLAQNSQQYEPVGRPLVHQSAFKHATGEAVYCDDLPTFENELYLCLVKSTRTFAQILSIDAEKALSILGVVAFFSAKDIAQQRNICGPVVADEEVFASEKVLCQGQIIGAVVATSLELAQKASVIINVEYQDLTPAIITIEDAIKYRSYFPNSPALSEKGSVEKSFSESELILEGELRIGGQEHFYLETQNTVAVPTQEDDEIVIYSSCQHPSDIQRMVSVLLGVPSNKIVCRVKRIGGGFGGKETRSCILALPVAFAAHKLNKPVRLSLDRKEDMLITGQRHPFLCKYKVAYNKIGKIIAAEVDLYCNAGCTLDLSDAVMERAMHHFTNAINIPNIKCRGFVCKTNLPSNTAFRGFGAPQAMMVGETIIFQVAESLGMDPNKIHEINFYKDGDITHYNQQITRSTVNQCWNQCLLQSRYEEQKVSIENFNRDNKWRKRGLAIIPTVYGAGFSTVFLNQAGALVMIYCDGSVLISHGGTEMGQGLHTKIIQVASQALDIPMDLIHISETSTDKVPNASPTAGSVSSDLNGMAVLNACKEIKNRLTPIIEKYPKASWKDLIREAYLERISLVASGFYRTPDIGPNQDGETDNVYNYFTFGAACSEVEIDCLTGDHQVLKTDIVMDIGESLNPAIDIGQIEGAFMQGYGLYTLEELIYSPKGILYSTGPGTYKIPAFSDIPAQFNVTLLKGSKNPRAVYSSKAVGEPPLFLAASVFFAIRNAIVAARRDEGYTNWFTFNSPATAANIRMACEDKITNKVLNLSTSNVNEKWNIVV